MVKTKSQKVLGANSWVLTPILNRVKPLLKPNLLNLTLTALGKVCGKLISRKLVLRDATQQLKIFDFST